MKKMLTFILAVIFCGVMSTSYAKVLVDGKTTPVGVTSAEQNINVNLADTGTNINWTSFDLDEGQTATFFNGDNSVNVITSNKASSILGTIIAKQGKLESEDCNGTITFINSKGFNIGNSFVFQGKEIMFGLNENSAILDIVTGNDKTFKFESGNLLISKTGNVTGGMTINNEEAEIAINADSQTVLVGDINAAKFEITGKVVYTGNLNFTEDSRITATSVVTTKAVTAGANLTIDGGRTVKVNGLLDVNVGETNIFGSNGIRLESVDVAENTALRVNSVANTVDDVDIYEIKTGYENAYVATDNLTSYGIIDIFGKNIKTANLTLDASQDTNAHIHLGAMKSVTAENADITGGFVLLSSVENTGTLTIGNATIENNGNLSAIDGKAVTIGNITSETGCSVICADDIMLLDDSTLPNTIKIGNITSPANVTLGLKALKSVNVGNIQLSNASAEDITNAAILPVISTISRVENVNILISGRNVQLGSCALDAAKMYVDGSAIAAGNMAGTNMEFKASNRISVIHLVNEGTSTMTTGNVIIANTITSNSDLALDSRVIQILNSLNVNAGETTIFSSNNLSFRTAQVAENAALRVNAVAVDDTGSYEVKAGYEGAGISTGNLSSNGAMDMFGTRITTKTITIDNSQDAYVHLGAAKLLYVKDASITRGTLQLSGIGNTGSLETGKIQIEENGQLSVFGAKIARIGNVTSQTGATIVGDVNAITVGNIKASVNLNLDLNARMVTVGNIELKDLSNDSNIGISGSNVFLGRCDFNTSVVNIVGNNISSNSVSGMNMDFQAKNKISITNLTNNGTMNLEAASFFAVNVTENGNSTFTVDSFNIGKYTSDAEKITTVDVTNKFIISNVSTANGTFELNKNNESLDGLNISIAKGTYFNELVVPEGKMEQGTALKRITSRNYADPASWDGTFTPAN